MGFRKPKFYFLARPNWIDGVKVGRAFLTTITESLTGEEERAALRSLPLRSVIYKVNTGKVKESAYVRRMVHKYQHELGGFPIWPDCALLTSEAASGQDVLTVNSTTYKEFEVGKEVIIVGDDWDTYEVGTVKSLTATQITLIANLSSTWATNSEVYPIIAARFNQSLTIVNDTDYYVNGVFDLTESFEATTTTTTTTTTTSSSSTTSSATTTTTTTTSSSTSSSTSSTASTVSTTSSTSSTVSTTSTTSSTVSTTSTTSSTVSTTSTTSSTTSSTTTTTSSSSTTTTTV